MFVDASAFVAMLLPEEDGPRLAMRLERSVQRLTSPIAIFETALALRRVFKISTGDAWQVLLAFVQRTNVSIAGVDQDAHLLALIAHDRYGKGTGHPAQLNMGDCFSYAMAKRAGVPLLYKGNDFALTDLA